MSRTTGFVLANTMMMTYATSEWARCLQLKEQKPKGSFRCAIFSAQEDFVCSTIEGTSCKIQCEQI